MTSGHYDSQPWAPECLDVKNYKWQLNLVWHRMLYTHMATVGIKGLIRPRWSFEWTMYRSGSRHKQLYIVVLHHFPSIPKSHYNLCIHATLCPPWANCHITNTARWPCVTVYDAPDRCKCHEKPWASLSADIVPGSNWWSAAELDDGCTCSPPVSRLLGIAVNYTHTYNVAHMTEPHVNMSGDYNVCQGDSIVVWMSLICTMPSYYAKLSVTSPGSPTSHPDCGFDNLIPTNLWCHPTISLPSAGGPFQSSPPIFGIVFLWTLPQHCRSRSSGSVSRLISFGILALT